LIDHESTDLGGLLLLYDGSTKIHNFLSEYTPPAAITTAAANKLILTDAASFRRLTTFIKSSMHESAYLINPLPQDNFTKVGNLKDTHLRTFLVIVLTTSKLDKTFKISQVNYTGHALYAKLKLHYLSNTDTLTEIQNLQTQFSQLKMTSGIQDLIEEAQGFVNALEELGQPTTNINFYIKLKSIIEEGGLHLSTLCISFRAFNQVPNDGTLELFISFITNDPRAMLVGIKSNNKTDKTDKADVNAIDVERERKSKRKERKAEKYKAYEAAMNALSLTKPGELHPVLPLPKIVINYIKKLREEWNDETYGIHSNMNKLYNAHLIKGGNGAIDYPGFLEQLVREHRAATTIPPHPPKKNQNVSNANALEADDFAAQVFKLKTVKEDPK
jgi:hypothetical protein